MIETVPSGTVLHGRYRIERVLGSGGFGHVYLAADLVDNQQYALKEYLVSGASGQEQLRHEASVLSQLHHPNLPAFHDAFNERGRYYVVLNYIEGNDLTDLIRMANRRNEIIPISKIIPWMIAISEAVMFLHSQQPPVIHRDIKPDNIRITPNGTAILVDLGNAKASADGARTLFFIRHQGTPGYAPPEQYPGGSGTDTRSDVYALGGTLYFALTSHEPPSVSIRNQNKQQGKPEIPSLQEQLAGNPPEESPEANAARQFRLGVSKPSKPAPRHSRHLAQLGTMPPDLLNQLNRVIQKAMAASPKDRYQYVADFADELRRVAQALPPLTPPPTTRPPDPHGTQPDLPMLYDALQAAKGANAPAPDKADRGTAPTPPPASPPSSASSAERCPRCNAALSPNAAFCPRCGLSLPQPPSSNRAGNAANTTPPIAKVAYHPTDDQTIIIKPQAQLQQQAPGFVPQVQQPPTSPTSNAQAAASTAPHYPGHSAYSTAPGVSSLATYPQQPQPQPQPPVAQANPIPPSQPGFTIEPRVIVFMIILLVLLVAIAVFLIILMSHHQSTASLNLHLLLLAGRSV